MNSVLPFAEQMLDRHGEFYPYGGAMRVDGQLTAVAGYDGRERPPSTDVIKFLKAALSAKAPELDRTAVSVGTGPDLAGSAARHQRGGRCHHARSRQGVGPRHARPKRGLRVAPVPLRALDPPCAWRPMPGHRDGEPVPEVRCERRLRRASNREQSLTPGRCTGTFT